MLLFRVICPRAGPGRCPQLLESSLLPSQPQSLSPVPPVPGLGAPPPPRTLSWGLEIGPSPLQGPLSSPDRRGPAQTPAAAPARTGSPAAGLWGDPTRPAPPPLPRVPPQAQGHLQPRVPSHAPGLFRPLHRHLGARPPPGSPGPSHRRDTRQRPRVPPTPPGPQHPSGSGQSGSAQGPGPARDVSPSLGVQGVSPAPQATSPAPLPAGYFRRWRCPAARQSQVEGRGARCSRGMRGLGVLPGRT